MSCNYNELQKSHPCFGGHKNNVGRIHLPVSPGCNIACRFCDRALNDVEQRPGVASKIVTPEESISILRKALELCPDITVAGIAGPGDTLASDYALETFRKVKKAFPRLLKCMSTNGLLLYERAEEIIEAGIDSLTVTVNAVDAYIEAVKRIKNIRFIFLCAWSRFGKFCLKMLFSPHKKLRFQFNQIL